MKLSAVHHIAVIASDYKKARHFYVDLLGLEVIRELHRPEKGDHKLDLRLGDCELELFVKPGSPARLSWPEACGLRHLAFRVDDIEAAVDWLRAKGIESEPLRVDPADNRRMTFFFDPDGLPLELHE